MSVTMTSVAISHPGLVRQNNEDCLRADDELSVYLLADGMGGHNAGEVASALAVDVAYTRLASLSGTVKESSLESLLRDAMDKAHQAVLNKSRSDLKLSGMGTTLVITVAVGNEIHICHVGDSRGYILSAVVGSFQQVTDDHSTGAMLVRTGALTKEQVPERYWHTLTQAIGIGEAIVPEYSRHTLAPGDILLLCSDGLTDMLEDTEIAIILKKESELQNAASSLIAAANDHGGKDNVSVVLVRCD